MNKTLFSRDFTLMLLGQIVSLLGNALLRFALSLYVLDLTGSAAVFGGVLAAAMVPTILLSPVGGVLADRVPRQRIMYVLDFLTAIAVWNFGMFGRGGSTLPPALLLFSLSALGALRRPPAGPRGGTDTGQRPGDPGRRPFLPVGPRFGGRSLRVLGDGAYLPCEWGVFSRFGGDGVLPPHPLCPRPRQG